MNIAELFVTLGIKGSEKTVGALTDVKKGLKDTASMSLEAKAALVGAMYALERLFATSGQRGTDLTNLNSVLGVSTKTLQQYEYAARQVGVSNQEVDGTFKSLQATMTKTLMNGDAPKGMARVAQLTGELNTRDIARFSEHPEELIKRLQDYAGKEKNVGLKNEVLKSFGISDNMIAALNRKAFTPQQLAKAPTYSDKEVGALDKANIGWSNLGNKIEMAIGHFNAKHGGQFVADLTKITDKVISLSEAFVKLAEKTKFFEIVGKSIQGWTLLIGLLTDSIDNAGKAAGGKEERTVGNIGKAAEGSTPGQKAMMALLNAFAPGGSGILGAIPDVFDALPKAAPNSEAYNKSIGLFNQTVPAPAGAARPNPPTTTAEKAARPNPPPGAAVSAPNSTQNVNVQQTLNFNHDGTDAPKTADSVKQAAQRYFRQSAAQPGGY